MRVAPAPLWLRRAAQAVLLMALLQITPGCTLVGTVIGSQIPRYEHVSNPRDLPVGSSVEVETEQVTWRELGPDRTQRESGWLRGQLLDNSSAAMVLRTESGRVGVVDPRDATDVKVRSGSYWAAGLGIGLGFDAAIVMAAVIATRDMFSWGDRWEQQRWDATTQGVH